MASIKKTIAAATEAVAQLIRTEPLTPQIFERLQRADGRRRKLRAEVDGLALDAQLGEPGALDRQRELEGELARAEAEVERLTAALKSAHARDDRSQAERTIVEVKADLETYRKVCAARVRVFRDLQTHAAAADAALHQYRQSIALMQTGAVPKLCSLPRGFLIDHKLASIGEIEAENSFLVDLLEKQVARIAIVLRGGEPDAETEAA